MPTLTAATRRRLRYLRQGGNANLNPGGLACWNWALTGFGPAPVNPNSIFGYVSGFYTVADLNLEGGWYATPATQASLLVLRNLWAPYRDLNHIPGGYAASFHQISLGCLRLAMEANGLQPSNAPSPYEVCMYYEDGLDGGGNLRAPNWTHWWLRIDGGGPHNDGIEAFPGNTSITIRRPEYDSLHVVRMYAPGLHQTHVTRITQAVALVTAATRLPRGAWALDNTRTTCHICNTLFGALTWKHHCRNCGRIICADCSPTTRALINPLVRPAGAAEVGAVRVCYHCE